MRVVFLEADGSIPAVPPYFGQIREVLRTFITVTGQNEPVTVHLLGDSQPCTMFSALGWAPQVDL